MPPTAPERPAPADRGLEHCVEAFESAHQGNSRADLNAFLPPADHPQYLRVAQELVCVDLDYGWARGEPTPLDEYRRRIPALFADPDAVGAIIWEDYRQRRQAGQDPDPEDYRRRFGASPIDPAVGAKSAARREIPATDAVSAANWIARLESLGNGVASGAADLYRAAHQSDPAVAERYARVMEALPRVGESFAGFRLEAELGRGAFGCVYLARQIALADRPVALKVSAELFGEDQTLARLQHTNIVPIYSPHRVGPLQAVAMPYFGGTTLADVLRALGGQSLPASGKHFVSTLRGRKDSTVIQPASGGRQPPGFRTHENQGADASRSPEAVPSTEALAALERLSYPDAVLWLGAKLADGLNHAHERGIVHRDLKPANILLKDDGQPLLLDFNLAENANLRSSEAGARIGGTLPYMAPEQIRAFGELDHLHGMDGRGDIYSLGLILFELLTGRQAFPVSAGAESAESRASPDIAKMLADRAGPPPRLRNINPAVSPAAEAIIRRCLEPDPGRRYQTARDLQDDIERHLAHLPLKHTPEPSVRERLAKWRRRHPRLTSGTSVAVLAAALLVVVGATAWGLNREVRRRDAVDQLGLFVAGTDKVLPRLIRSVDADRREESMDAARHAVAGYGVLDRPDWQAGPLVTDLPPAEQARLRGRVSELLFLLAQAAVDQPTEKPDRVGEALRFNDLAGSCFPDAARPRAWWEQREMLYIQIGDRAAAARAAAEAKQLDLKTPTDLYLAALRLSQIGRFAEALPLLDRATTADPRHFWAWFLRGNCHAFQGQSAEAARCYSVCIGLDPTQARLYLNRARIMLQQRAFVQATEDTDRAATLDPEWIDAHVEAAVIRYRHAVALTRAANLQAARNDLLAKAGSDLSTDQRTLLKEADDRLTDILRRPDAPARCYFHRADVRRMLGDKAGEIADNDRGFAREPTENDEVSWILRGLHRPTKDAAKALVDFRRAEQINPQSVSALKNQANVLAGQVLNRPAEALVVLNRLLAQYPDMPEAHASRGVVLARLGRIPEALADAEWAKSHSADPVVTYMVGNVYAWAGDTPGALRFLVTALTQGFGFSQLATDRDLDPIRRRPEFQRLADAVRTLQEFLKPADQSSAVNTAPR